MIQNGIQFEGIAALADCIKFSPNLRILNLNDNIMTPRGAIAIAKVRLALQDFISFAETHIKYNVNNN